MQISSVYPWCRQFGCNIFSTQSASSLDSWRYISIILMLEFNLNFVLYIETLTSVRDYSRLPCSTGYSFQDTDIWFSSYDPKFQGAEDFAMKKVDLAKPEVELSKNIKISIYNMCFIKESNQVFTKCIFNTLN